MAFNISNNKTSYQRLNDESLPKDVLHHFSDYFNSLRLLNAVGAPDASRYQQTSLQPESPSSSSFRTDLTSPALSTAGWCIFSPPIFSSGAYSSLSSANTSQSNISATATGLSTTKSNTVALLSPPPVTSRFPQRPTQLSQPSTIPLKPINFYRYLNITKPYRGALTIGHSTHDGIAFHDCTTTKFLFHRQNMTITPNLRKFTLYNGDDSIDPIIASSKSSLIKSIGARNQVSIDLTSRPETSYELNAMYLENDIYTRSFKFKLPGNEKPSRFVWRNSKSSVAVKELERKAFAMGMKLVDMETREVVMAYVKPARWEKVKSRSGKMKGRVGFMGNRYGAEFEGLAIFSLLIMIDSKWDR